MAKPTKKPAPKKPPARSKKPSLPKTDAPAKPGRKGRRPQNAHEAAKAAGIDTSLPDLPTPEIKLRLHVDHQEPSTPTPGRPTKLTVVLAERVLNYVARRGVLSQIHLSGEGMPHDGTVYAWLAHDHEGPDGKLYAAFQEAYTRACTARADTRGDAIADYIDRATNKNRAARGEMLDPQQAKVGIDGQRILMELENRTKYGKAVALVGDPAHPVEVAQRTVLEISREQLLVIAAGGIKNQT